MQSYTWAVYITLHTIIHLSRVHYSTYNHTLGQRTLLYIQCNHTFGQRKLLYMQSYTWGVYITLHTMQSHTWAVYITLQAIIHLGSVHYSTYNHTFGQCTLLYMQSYTWAVYITLHTIIHLGSVCYCTYNHTLGQHMLLYLQSHTWTEYVQSYTGLDRVCCSTTILHWVGQGTFCYKLVTVKCNGSFIPLNSEIATIMLKFHIINF